jgi:hypothetical protein
MQKLKMPPQITRLAIVAVAIVVSYFGARFFLVPKSFGKYGWYRADTLKEYAALPISYGGAKACEECHSDEVAAKAKGGHKLISCESCHGPLSAHAADPTTVSPGKITNLRFCVRCHESNMSLPEKFPQVKVEEHAGKSNCVECHLGHQPKEQPKKKESKPAS